jgi:single-stranded DNA-binding protein
MTIQMATRAKGMVDGELVEKPSFLMSRQTKYADLQLKTVKNTIVGAERRRTESVHLVRVFKARSLELLETFGQPGRHFHVEGEISYRSSDGRMMITVGTESGELVLNYMGEDAQPVTKAAPGERRQGGEQQSNARPAGGVGKLSRSAGQPQSRDEDDRADSQDRGRGYNDPDDDRIPF